MKEESFSCPTCSKLFEDEDVLLTHLNTECDRDLLESSQCHLQSESKNPLKNDVEHNKEPEEKEIPRFTCPKCSLFFETEEYLITHVTRNHERVYKCSKCLVKCKSTLSLAIHLYKYCTGYNKRAGLKCANCKKSFSTRKALLKHLRQVCEKSASCPMKCATCKRSFSTRKALLKHLHHVCERPATFACASCPFKANKKRSLRGHIEIMHSDKGRIDPGDDQGHIFETLNPVSSTPV